MTRYTPLWLQAGSYPAGTDRRLIAALWPTAATSGCAVSVGSGMQVNVAPGSVAVPTQNGTGSSLCTSDAVEPVTLASAPASGTNRYDLVICQPRGNDLDGGANNDFIFTTVTGVPLASPVVPTVPAGAVALAQIYVAGGSASVVAGNITDIRPGWGLSISHPSIFLDLVGSGAQNLVTGAAQKMNAIWGGPPRLNLGGGTFANGTYTVPRAARLRITFQWGVNMNQLYSANFVLACTLFRNGATLNTAAQIFLTNLTQGFGAVVGNSRVLDCAAGDTIELWVSESYITATHTIVPGNCVLNIEESAISL